MAVARGGDVIRFVELFHGVPFGEALAVLRRWSGAGSLLSDVIQFYQLQLQRHPEAVAYLAQRGVHQPELVEQMRIGYAPGGCLRAHLMCMGYSLGDLQQAGVVTLEGLDTMAHRLIFPLEANLYGRSLGHASPHRFLPGGKGGLYDWQSVRNCRELVLVEGLFDWASLWQAGFRNMTCSLGTCLNATQFRSVVRRRHAYRLSGVRLRCQRQRSASRSSDSRSACRLTASKSSLWSCPMVTIPTASSSTAAVMRISFKRSWRGRAHDLRVGLSGRLGQRAEPVSRGRSTDAARGGLDQSLSGPVHGPRSGLAHATWLRFSLTHFIRWWAERHSTEEVTGQALTRFLFARLYALSSRPTASPRR